MVGGECPRRDGLEGAGGRVQRGGEDAFPKAQVDPQRHNDPSGRQSCDLGVERPIDDLRISLDAYLVFDYRPIVSDIRFSGHGCAIAANACTITSTSWAVLYMPNEARQVAVRP